MVRLRRTDYVVLRNQPTEINMSNLATKNQEDYTIHPDGTAFTTQRKAAEMCGINQSSLSRFCASSNYDVNQGLSTETLSLCITHYARKGRPEAVAMLVKFAEAGAQAYIYTEAGYSITVTPPGAETAPVGSPEYLTRADVTEIVVEVFKQLLPHLGSQAVAVPTEPVVERAAHPFRPLAPGFLPWREARQLHLPGHSEAVFHQVMEAGNVSKLVFDVQFSDMQVNRDCVSYQENQIAFACNQFISQSRRKLRKDGTPTQDKWVNPLLGQTYYVYAGDYELSRPYSFL